MRRLRPAIAVVLLVSVHHEQCVVVAALHARQHHFSALFTLAGIILDCEEIPLTTGIYANDNTGAELAIFGAKVAVVSIDRPADALKACCQEGPITKVN